MAEKLSQQTSQAADGIPDLREEDKQTAAVSIQRAYRGHRTRRALKGHTLDPSTRWDEALRDVQFRRLTAIRGPSSPGEKPASAIVDSDSGRATSARSDDGSPFPDPQVSPSPVSPARKQWHRVGQIALRAGADDSISTLTDSDSDSESDTPSGIADSSTNGRAQWASREEKSARRQKRARARNDRKKTAKMMDLQYFLEMVDHKHRYGSNLRAYHNYWKDQPTTENFFYWLDYGEGKTVEVAQCSRERLEKEQVRYLSREERLDYLVKVDKEGRFCWAKNGERISTRDEDYRDSIRGIVPRDSDEPRFRVNKESGEAEARSSGSESSSNLESKETEPYANEAFHQARGPSKIAHVSPAVIFNHLIRTSVKRGNKWIFVADTSFRLYVGIKESGAFQHSSFLHGARISAAGLIKIKDGQLRSLAPLSGHYRPPSANFRAFIHSLRDEGVDMSRVSISKSYAVLVGIEGYMKTKKRFQQAEKDVRHQADKVVHPDKARADEEKMIDKSESAEKERRWLENQRTGRIQKEEEEKQKRREMGLAARLKKKIPWGAEQQAPSASEVEKGSMALTNSGPEDGAPPPEGKR